MDPKVEPTEEDAKVDAEGRLDVSKKGLGDARMEKLLGFVTFVDVLMASKNALGVFPHRLCGDLRMLTMLFLSKNYICELPRAIGNLLCLERLDLSDNNLMELPGEILLLQKLEEFDCSSNLLVWLPQLGKLKVFLPVLFCFI